MNIRILPLILSMSVIAGLLSGCASVTPLDVLNYVVPDSHDQRQTVSYGQSPRQTMDIYLPKKNGGKTPIVFVYGGAWKEGNKEDYAFVAHALSKRGHPVIVPDYQLYPDVRFPTFVEDVANAITWLDKNDHQLLPQQTTTSEPNKYVLMGHSAGAHTAALLATDRHYLKHSGFSGELAGLIAMAGPYDLPLDDPEVIPIFTTNGKLSSPRQAKPLLNVHTDMPPVLLLHGADDKRVFPLHTRRFSAALENAGVEQETHIYKGVNHTRLIGSLAPPLRFLNDSFEDIRQFLLDI